MDNKRFFVESSDVLVLFLPKLFVMIQIDLNRFYPMMNLLNVFIFLNIGQIWTIW